MWLFIIAVLFGLILQQEFTESWPDPHLRSKGDIWPKPQYIVMADDLMTVNLESFTFLSNVGECEIIDKAITRYDKRLRSKKQFIKSRSYKQENSKETNDVVKFI